METWKSAKQIQSEKDELISGLKKENKNLKVALQRIANTYNNVEDLAGVIARTALDENK